MDVNVVVNAEIKISHDQKFALQFMVSNEIIYSQCEWF